MESTARSSFARPFLVACLVGWGLAPSPSSAQVDVTATAGTPAASYTTLKGAFDAINAGTHQGTITIDISGNTTETAPAVINASGAGASVYTSITISPTSGAARTIAGAMPPGSPLIDFNGADNVTFDGINVGGRSLTMTNSTASATSGTSTLRFIGGATHNLVTRSTIRGSSTSSATNNGGTIFFSTDGVTANGNDDNTISHNDIGPAGATLHSKAIYCNGTTTTTALGNSGVVIHDNNIFDYFHANATSAGIATDEGCNTWTITNNRLYQTGTRTWTSPSSLHAGMNLGDTAATSGAQGFTITGNVIGFASNTQTGTYTLTGTGNGAKFAGIVFNGMASGTTTHVHDNTVAGVRMTGVTANGTAQNSPFVALFLRQGNIASNGNTVGSPTATGSLTFSTTTTTATDVYGIYNATSNAWTSNDNTVGGISAANLGPSVTLLVGMRAQTTSGAPPWSATGNTVGGNVAGSIGLSAIGGGSQVLGMFTNNAVTVLTSNTVRNLTSNVGTGTGGAASVIGISVSSLGGNQTLSRNTISNLTNTHATAASVVIGLRFGGSIANLVERNSIYGLTVASDSAAAEVTGIRADFGISTFRNNMVALGAGISNAIGAAATNAGTAGINGIVDGQGGTNTFWHNSVYIGGAPTAGAGSSYAFNGVQTGSNRSFRDNVFWNARTNAGATGKNYAIKINGTAPNPSGLTLNNNVYFANGAGGVFGFFNSLDVPDLGAWKIAVGQDAASIEGHPQYNDPTNATPDLHIHPTNPTVVDGNGVDQGVADDFDGQTRSGLTPVDIGADAGNFVGIDLTSPILVYTPLRNTAQTSNRVLSATITDGVSGVPVAGAGLPVLYYRKGAVGAFAAAQASSAGAGVYDFTIDYSLVAGGSVATGDTIQYYVVAQDGAPSPNVAASPAAGAGGFTANPPAATTPPTTPSSYTIVVPISGIKTVGCGGCDYFTLTGDNSAFKAINDSVVTGNVEIQIVADIFGEDGSNGLNVPVEEPAGSNFTIRIYPTGAPRLVTGSFPGAMYRLNGASRVTLDGSLGGVGTDRSLTLRNSNLTTPTVVLIGSVGATPVTNDTLENCVVVNGSGSTGPAVVVSDAAAVGSAGLFSNITIQNNDIRRASVGVFANGGTMPQGGSNLITTQNEIDGTGVDVVRNVGLHVQGVNGATISDNTVANLDNTGNENDVGIWLATGTINANVSGNTVSGLGYTGTGGHGAIGIHVTSGVANTNNVIAGNMVSDISSNGGSAGSLARGIAVGGATSDLTIEGNDVHNIVNTSTGTFPAYGLDVSGGNNVVVRNNFVSGVSFDMTGGAAFSTSSGVFGIRVGAGTGHRIYNNSVNLGGALPGTPAASLLTAAFGIVAATSTDVDVRDNVFANNVTGGTTSIAHVAAYLPAGATSAMNLTWNNNAYFYGTDAARQGAGQAGTVAGANFFPTLPALAAYSNTLSPPGTNDNASLESTGAVPFAGATDLHLVPSSPLATAGVPLAGVTIDIDGELRSATTPSIGADEVPADLSITKTDGVTTVAAGGSTTYTITASNPGPSGTTATVADTFPASLTCNWTCDGAGGGTCTPAGAGNINDAVVLPAGGSVTYTASCAISGAAAGSLSNTATVTGVVTDPMPGNNSATDTDTLTPAANLGITKTDGVTTYTPGGSTTYTITASNAGPSNTTATVADTFPAVLTCNWTCAGAGGGTCTAAGSGNISDGATLPAGGSVTYTASCSISAATSGSLSNTATVTGAATDLVPGNNSATDTDSASASADLAITKTDGVTTYAPGGSTTYTITASNAGPSNTTATVSDSFPGSLTCSWTCVGDSGGTCTALGSGNIADPVTLPARGSVTYTASCTISVTASGNLDNTATVSGVASDPNPANNSATDSDTSAPSADLSITTTDGTGIYTPGGSTTYTITASNAGPSNAPSSTVADTFVAELTCTWTCVAAGGGTCTASGSGNISDTVGLPAGGSVTYAASCNISPSATGSLVNTATVAAPGGTTDPTPANNSATDSDTSAPSADLSITKTDGTGVYTPGASTTYTITASNAGPSNAPGSTVADAFVAELTCTWTCVGSGGGTCTASGSGNINDTVGLPAGGSVTYTASCDISPSAAGSLLNAAAVTAPGGTTDPVPGNNGAADSDMPAASADLGITKSDGVTTANPGGSVTYTITASNAGPSNAPGSTVADSFPDSLACSWTCVGAGGGTCTASGSGSISDTANLPAGGSVTYVASCNIAASATGSLSNTATVAAPGDVTDPVPGNNSATDTDTLTPEADLGITKTDGITSTVPGGSLTYTIIASNAGPSNAPGSTVDDTIPASLTCTWTCVGSGGGACNELGSGNIGDTVNLPAGGSVTYTASCTVAPGATGTLVNTATVAAGGSVVDPDPDDNAATDSDLVSDPGSFFTLTPCRLLDTRIDGQGPALSAGVDRALIVPPTCGVPVTARALAVNLTVVGASAGGNLVAWPGDIAMPATSVLNFAAAQTRSNNAILKLPTDGSGRALFRANLAGGGTVHLIVDVVGYFE